MADSNRDDHLEPEEVDQRFRELVGDLEDPELEKELKEDKAPAPEPEEKEEPTLLELWDAELPDDEDEEQEYVAPEPPPIPWPSLPAVGGLISVLAGLLTLFQPGWMPFPTTLARVVGISLFGFGVWLLINQLRDEPDDGGRGDGAVVLGVTTLGYYEPRPMGTDGSTVTFIRSVHACENMGNDLLRRTCPDVALASSPAFVLRHFTSALKDGALRLNPVAGQLLSKIR